MRRKRQRQILFFVLLCMFENIVFVLEAKNKHILKKYFPNILKFVPTLTNVYSFFYNSYSSRKYNWCSNWRLSLSEQQTTERYSYFLNVTRKKNKHIEKA